MYKQKIISILTILIIWFNIGYVNVFASIDFNKNLWSNKYNNVSNKKIKKLLKLWEKLKTFIKIDLIKEINKLKNEDDKKIFLKELKIHSDNIEVFLKQIEYAYDFDFEKYLKELKALATSYKNFKKDIISSIDNWVNPYKISDSEIQIIENDIISIQKDFIAEIKKYLDTYNLSSFKETWKMNFDLSTELWNLNINIEKYSSIFSIITWSQELDVVLNVSFSWVTDKELEKPTSINLDLKADINIKLIKEDLYVNLKSYKIDFNTSDEFLKETTLKQINSIKSDILDKIVWKTILFSWIAKNAEQLNQADLLNKINKVFDLLSINSLFKPFKKINTEDYLLILNKNVYKQIWTIFNEKISDEDLDKWNNELRINSKHKFINLIYSKDWDNIKLSFNTKNETTISQISLKKELNSYIFEWNLEWQWYTSWNKISFSIKNNYLYLDLIAEEVLMNLKWDNNFLDAVFKTDDINFNVKWDLSEDKTDLQINFNSKNVWGLKINKLDTKYEYDFYLTIDIPNDIYDEWYWFPIKTINFKIIWDKDIQKWDFIIEKPDTFIDSETLKLNDFDF